MPFRMLYTRTRAVPVLFVYFLRLLSVGDLPPLLRLCATRSPTGVLSAFGGGEVDFRLRSARGEHWKHLAACRILWRRANAVFYKRGQIVFFGMLAAMNLSGSVAAGAAAGCIWLTLVLLPIVSRCVLLSLPCARVRDRHVPRRGGAGVWDPHAGAAENETTASSSGMRRVSIAGSCAGRRATRASTCSSPAVPLGERAAPSSARTFPKGRPALTSPGPAQDRARNGRGLCAQGQSCDHHGAHRGTPWATPPPPAAREKRGFGRVAQRCALSVARRRASSRALWKRSGGRRATIPRRSVLLDLPDPTVPPRTSA